MGSDGGWRNSGRERLLVCLDLQQGSVAHSHAPERCLVNCRRMLAYAREAGWRVAHVHSRKPHPREAEPIAGLQPLLSEPVLYRSGPSAFSNRAFYELTRDGAAELVLIGYSITSALVGTAMVAFEEGLSVVMVEDAICPAVLDGETRDAIAYLSLKAVRPFVTLSCTEDLIGRPRLRRVV